jgi:hypothetical protein
VDKLAKSELLVSAAGRLRRRRLAAESKRRRITGVF